jgi:hypothetical protein
MKETANKKLRKNPQPAKRFVSTVRENPYGSLAALATIATLGIGVAYLRPNRLQPDTGKNPSLPPLSTLPENSYFEAAPRSISGSHRLQLPATAQSGKMLKKGGVIIGSAAFLTSLYLLGRRK